jgi:hypothetical protein
VVTLFEPHADCYKFTHFKKRVYSSNCAQLDNVKEGILHWISSNGPFGRPEFKDLSLLRCNSTSMGKYFLMSSTIVVLSVPKFKQCKKYSV